MRLYRIPMRFTSLAAFLLLLALAVPHALGNRILSITSRQEDLFKGDTTLTALSLTMDLSEDAFFSKNGTIFFQHDRPALLTLETPL